MSVDRLQEIVARVLQLAPRAVEDSTSPKTSPNWDSVGHLNLILEIEAELGVRFSVEEIPELDSVAQIRAALGRKGVTIPAAP